MSSESLARAPFLAAASLPEERPRAPRPRCSNWLEIAWIVLLFFLLGSGPAPAINEPHYLSRAKHYWDPDFCRGDFFLESRDAHPVFFAAFGWLTRWLSLPAAAWIGRFLGWTLLAAAWQRLSATVASQPGSSLLSAAIWVTLIQRAHMSGEWVVGGIEAKVFAYACVLWGLSQWVRGHFNRAWVLLGVASAFHVLVGGWAVVLVLAASGLSGVAARRRLARSLTGLVAGGAISLAGLLPAWQLNADAPAKLVRRAEEIYVLDRIAHHLLIRNFDGVHVMRHALLLALFAMFWFALRDNHRWAQLGRVVWGAVLLALIGTLLDVLLGDTPWAAQWLRYYWFRAADVFVPLGVSLGVVLLLIRWSSTWPRGAAAGLGLTVALVGANLVATVGQLQRQPFPAAELQGGIKTESQWSAWQDVCNWVNEHVPASTTLLTPADHQTFKWYAKRGEVVTWKDVPQDAASIVEWSKRLTRVRRWEQSRTITESNARFAALVDDYKFQHAVIRWPAVFPLPSWPVVYRNSDYVVLRADVGAGR
jgi:hypothetical protein